MKYLLAQLCAIKYSYINELCSFAEAQATLANYRLAESACRIALALHPMDHDTLVRLSKVHVSLGNSELAIRILDPLQFLDPPTPQLLHALGHAFFHQGEYRKAAEFARRALELQPRSESSLLLMNQVLREEDKAEEGISFLHRALEIDSNSPKANGALGRAYLDLGNITAAIHHFELAKQGAPDQSVAYYNLARMNYYTSPDHKDIRILNRNALNKNSNYVERITFHFALGEIYDKLGHWDQAFFHFKAGNMLEQKLGGIKWSQRVDLARLVEGNIRVFNKNTHRNQPHSSLEFKSERLIFVVGMPRSGTTLVEQILASHPNVAAGGERNDMMNLIEDIFRNTGSKTKYPMCLAATDIDQIYELALEYINKLPELKEGQCRFVDKTPFNFWHLGLLATCFPNARIVHCIRNPMDTCISCYVQNFTNVRWSTSLKGIATYFKYYRIMMEYWRKTLNINMFELQYEHLVYDQQNVIRNLIEFCGVCWDDRCLEPHRTRRIVKTASAWQVRYPINASSIGRWKNYEKYLSRLRKAIDPEAMVCVGNPRPVSEGLPSYSSPACG